MSFRPNPLSFLGRMGYGLHLLAYPGIVGVYLYVVKPYMKNGEEKSEKDQWDSMPKTTKVDPDLFNPFSPIPYHNNPELKYGFAHIHMHGYLNENHINTKQYVYKNYHNSYDHDNKSSYVYNWVSLHSPNDNDHRNDHHPAPAKHWGTRVNHIEREVGLEDNAITEIRVVNKCFMFEINCESTQVKAD